MEVIQKIGQDVLEIFSNQSRSSMESIKGKTIRKVTFFVDGTVFVHPEEPKQNQIPNLFDILNPKHSNSDELILQVPPREVPPLRAIFS